MAIEMTRGADGSVMTMHFASDKTKAQYRLEALYSDALRELTLVSSATLGDEV